MRCCAPAREGSDDEREVAQATPARASRSGFVDVAACEFAMGNDGPDANPGDCEGPVRSVRVEAFSIGAAAVTNRAFHDFVTATGYVTDAERCGASFVFYLQVPAGRRASLRRVAPGLPWWAEVTGACWRNPEGSGVGHRHAGGTIRSCTSRGTTRARTAHGPAHACRAKRNGSAPHAEGSSGSASHGATIS